MVTHAVYQCQYVLLLNNEWKSGFGHVLFSQIKKGDGKTCQELRGERNSGYKAEKRVWNSDLLECRTSNGIQEFFFFSIFVFLEIFTTPMQ